MVDVPNLNSIFYELDCCWSNEFLNLLPRLIPPYSRSFYLVMHVLSLPTMMFFNILMEKRSVVMKDKEQVIRNSGNSEFGTRNELLV